MPKLAVYLQQVKLSIVALGRTRVRARIHPHFKLPRRQVQGLILLHLTCMLVRTKVQLR